ncbi:cupin-like domain-containing protein [Ningiella sp. W23]|uniref:cupin-like domain-containing protein n=1 Tax=Ningiella sp. W23 TaxID=3023715 RepID=UPI0037570EBE
MQKLKEIHLSGESELTEQMLKAEYPIVFRNLVSDWPIVKLCENNTDPQKRLHAQAEYLQRFSAGATVPAWVADKKEKGRFFYNQDMSGFNFEQQRLPFNDVLAWLVANADDEDIASVYLGSTSVDLLMPNYRKQNDIALLNKAPLVSLWMGNRSRVAPHYDATDNVACVLAGRRKFTLFAPEQYDNLYVGPIEFNPAGQAISLVDLHAPDFKQYPKFEQALENAFEATLLPGDAIFIPSMWWHHVEALDAFNLLQNYWWRQAPEPAANPNDALVHAMLSIKDLPQAQKEVWKDIFDKLIFNPQPQTHIPDSAQGFLKPLDEEQAARMRKLLLKRLQ